MPQPSLAKSQQLQSMTLMGIGENRAPHSDCRKEPEGEILLGLKWQGAYQVKAITPGNANCNSNTLAALVSKIS